MKEDARSAINCISGGVDSVTTAYYVKKTLKPKDQLLIFCDYKQRTYDTRSSASRKSQGTSIFRSRS